MSLFESLQVGKPLPFDDDYIQDRQAEAFYESSFEVDDAYIDGKNAKGEEILTKFTCEELDDYKQRQLITKPRNYVGAIVSKYNSAVFRNEIDRTTEDPTYQLLLKDIDGHKTKIDDFFKKALKCAQIKGESFVLIDSTSPNDGRTLSVTQARIIGARPFLRLVENDAVINYTELEGFLTEALVALESETKPFVRYFNTEEYCDIFYDSTGADTRITSITELKPHGYSDIPLVKCEPDVHGESQVAPIATNQQAITNLLSLLALETYESTFTRWVLSGVRLPEDKKDHNISFGAKRLIVLEDTGASLNRMGSDVTQSDSIRASIKEEEEALYKNAGLQATNITATESGLSKLIGLEDFFILTKGLADTMENLENKIMTLVAEVSGFEYIPVDYPDSFQETDYAADIQALRDLLALPLPEAVKNQAIETFVEIHIPLAELDTETLVETSVVTTQAENETSTETNG